MRLSLLHTTILFASLNHVQAINASESFLDSSATFATSPNTPNGGTTLTAAYGISPSSSPGSVSMTSSDEKMMTTGTPSATVSASGSIQSRMAAMLNVTAVASGSRTSRTANATNIATTSAPTTGLGNKNIAGQIRGFTDTAGIVVLIGMFAGL